MPSSLWRHKQGLEDPHGAQIFGFPSALSTQRGPGHHVQRLFPDCAALDGVVAVGNAGGAAGMAYLDGLCGRRVTR